MAFFLLGRRRRAFPVEEDVREPDEDERELINFERHCNLLDTRQYHGLQRVQIEIWLLFEDASSSVAAQVVQTGILLLIIFSTILILVQSYTECKWVQGTICVGTVCTPFDELTSCDPVSFTSSDERCTRVCPKRLEPLEPGGPVHFFVMDAFCIGIFTIEFVARMLCSPATVGLRTFMLSLANWIDVIAIVPFYIDIVFILAASESDLKVLAILRIVRLTRVLRVLKFSKSLRGIVVLMRTVVKSGSAMALILTFALLNCVLWASLMNATTEVGQYSAANQQYARMDGEVSMFAHVFEAWWWCLQTLTSLGYGTPWVPITIIGQFCAMATALIGTVVLALPIAVVGQNFDEEWNKQAKASQFQTVSCVYEYNLYTRYGTHTVKPRSKTSLYKRIRGWVTALVSTVLLRSRRVDPSPVDDPSPRLEEDDNTYGAGGSAARSNAEIAQQRSTRGTLFTASGHSENQAYNLQADFHSLLDMHFRTVRKSTINILQEQREKLTRGVNTDLKAALRGHVLASSSVAAFKASVDSSPSKLSIAALETRAGFVGLAARAHKIARESPRKEVSGTEDERATGSPTAPRLAGAGVPPDEVSEYSPPQS